ncbi:MAG: hypothetical protein P8Z35_02025 [Ignavibacteriaceae bacterium]
MVVRGFYDKVEEGDIDPVLHNEVKKINRAGNFTTILFIALTIGYYYLLYHFWGIGVVLVAAMLMIGRVQDLLYERKTVRKVTAKYYPKGIISVTSSILVWGAFIVLWFALYYQ